MPQAKIQDLAETIVFDYLSHSKSWLTRNDLRVVEVLKIGNNTRVTITISSYAYELFIVEYDGHLNMATLRSYKEEEKIDIRDPWSARMRPIV